MTIAAISIISSTLGALVGSMLGWIARGTKQPVKRRIEATIKWRPGTVPYVVRDEPLDISKAMRRRA